MSSVVPRRMAVAFVGFVCVPALCYVAVLAFIAYRDAQEERSQWIKRRAEVLEHMRLEFLHQLETVAFAAAYRAMTVQPVDTEPYDALQGFRMVIRVRNGRLVDPSIPAIEHHSRWQSDLQRDLNSLIAVPTAGRSDRWRKWLLNVRYGYNRAQWPSKKHLEIAMQMADEQRNVPVTTAVAAINQKIKAFPSMQLQFERELWLAITKHRSRQVWVLVNGGSDLARFVPQTENDGLFVSVDVATAVKTFNSISSHGVLELPAAGTGEWMGPKFVGLRLAVRLREAAGNRNFPNAGILAFGIGTVLVISVFSGWLLYRYAQRDLQIARLRNDFVASVTHELRTPLTSIRMFAEMLELATANGSRDTLREYTTTIVQETARLTRLVENVLTFSRLEKNTYTLHESRLALPELVHSAIDAVQAQLKAGGFTTTVHIDSPLPSVRGDADALHQAVVNILSNAIKYGGASRHIAVEVRRLTRAVSIEITDRGIGISSEHRARVFEKFYRVPNEQTAHVPGAGVGLAIVKQVIEAHRGHVAVDSCPGQGSKFTIELPADAA